MHEEAAGVDLAFLDERGRPIPAAPRDRTFATHDGDGTWRRPYYDLLHVFAVNGRVTDPEAWRYDRAVFAPSLDREAQWRTHRVGLWTVCVELLVSPSWRYAEDDRRGVMLRGDL